MAAVVISAPSSGADSAGAPGSAHSVYGGGPSELQERSLQCGMCTIGTATGQASHDQQLQPAVSENNFICCRLSSSRFPVDIGSYRLRDGHLPDQTPLSSIEKSQTLQPTPLSTRRIHSTGKHTLRSVSARASSRAPSFVRRAVHQPARQSPPHHTAQGSRGSGAPNQPSTPSPPPFLFFSSNLAACSQCQVPDRLPALPPAIPALKPLEAPSQSIALQSRSSSSSSPQWVL
ncbi:hypothetical protein PtA15_9A84 [Puccinia triticina]|uniref:Uncharacterized protein n=1 Tax=Puccinia triticina TaxID=208348 RepID=A0ABY7CTF2_9BASI|nr:uncharacterized protein PtA15_9A84 [Puccinia triticina]WAQ87960.1 hypothetical protein PtA15_9A84 [Puccinia triticina]